MVYNGMVNVSLTLIGPCHSKDAYGGDHGWSDGNQVVQVDLVKVRNGWSTNFGIDPRYPQNCAEAFK
jgi:hypothetical protein